MQFYNESKLKRNWSKVLPMGQEEAEAMPSGMAVIAAVQHLNTVAITASFWLSATAAVLRL